jgi:hypothetical protein
MEDQYLQTDDDTVIRDENQTVVVAEDDIHPLDTLDHEEISRLLNAIGAGLVKIAEKMPDFGVTAVEKLMNFGATAAERLKDHGATAAERLKDHGAIAAERLKDHGAIAAERLKDHGAIAAERMKDHGATGKLKGIGTTAAKSIENAKKYMTNAAVLITCMVLTSIIVKH